MNTIRTISATAIAVPDNRVAAEWTPPSSIEWAPAGRSTISATMGADPWTGIVITSPEDAMRLDADLQRLLAESRDGKRSRPYVDFDHSGGAAAAIPVKFEWRDGIRLIVEWTKAGLEAIAGRVYSYVSPEFILGDDSHPRSLPSPGAIASLVNAPAFQRIQRIAATNNSNTKMPKLIETLVAAGFVPDGVTDEEKAATHFADNIKAANRARDENATLKARLGEAERREADAAEKRKSEVEAEVDEAIKAGHCDPDTRDIVVAAILDDPEKGRKLLKGAQRPEQKKHAVAGERPVRAALGHGSASEEEDRIRAEANPERRRILRAEWYTREQTRHIKAANTIDPGLVVPIATEAVITKLGAALAPLGAFSMTFTAEPMAPQVPQIVTLASASSTDVLRNPTNFNQSFVAMVPITVSPNQLVMPWNLTNRNIQDGLSMTSAAEANIQALAEAVMLDVLKVIDATNFPGEQVTEKVSEWSTKGVKHAFAVIANGRVRNLVVSPAIFAEIMHVDSKSFVLTPSQQGAGAYGFSGIWFQNLWARRVADGGPVAGLSGFVCDPQAIAGITGVPLVAPGAAAAGLTTTTATSNNGIVVAFNTWFDLASRQPQMSYDIMVGFAKGDSTAGHLVIPTAEVFLAAT